ncbi:MAG: ERCC4 domain-containing protein [Fervidobacterium sp.]
MQKILKPDNKLVVLVDDRESNNIPFYLKEFGCTVNIQRLEVGDFIISDRTCIERKSAEDFTSSVINGRVFQQAEEMKRNFEKNFLIIEGKNLDGRITENALKAAIATLTLKYGVDVITTDNDKETARMLYWMAKKEQEEFKRIVGIKGKKKPKEIEHIQEYFLSSLPGISTVLSKRLLDHFKNIKNIINANEDELAKVKGISKNHAKRLCEIFNKKRG